MVDEFLVVCQWIGCPVSLEKTEQALPRMIFLGVLLDGDTKRLAILADKRAKALTYLDWSIVNWKVMIKHVQQLTGILNFLN